MTNVYYRFACTQSNTIHNTAQHNKNSSIVATTTTKQVQQCSSRQQVQTINHRTHTGRQPLPRNPAAASVGYILHSHGYLRQVIKLCKSKIFYRHLLVYRAEAPKPKTREGPDNAQFAKELNTRAVCARRVRARTHAMDLYRRPACF